jgi:hypothetical protein
LTLRHSAGSWMSNPGSDGRDCLLLTWFCAATAFVVHRFLSFDQQNTYRTRAGAYDSSFNLGI